jgi:inner membrane protein
MDSLTQIALGGAVGEAVLGKKVGNKAILWGAIGGALPDLDVLAYPLIDSVTKLSWHRGYSHSLMFASLFSPILGWLISKVHKNSEANWRDWSLLSFWAIFTHIVLDCFTNYGTQVFLPFSDYRVAFNNIFIIDPLYTIPILVCLIAVLFINRSSPKRRRLNAIGLGLSSIYILLTIMFKFYAGAQFEHSLKEQGIAYQRYMTNPTPFNSILWRAVAESEEGYWIGYYSLFDSDQRIPFQFIERNEELIDSIRDERAVKMLKWFSDGYYVVTNHHGSMKFHDLRFGEFVEADNNAATASNFGLGEPDDLRYVFTFVLVNGQENEEGNIAIMREGFSVKNTSVVLKQLLQRIQGV